MEVNTTPIDEWKDGGNDAQLHADEHADEGTADLLMRIHHGQLQISEGCPRLSKLKSH
jgi:hypothetical protein